MNREQQAILTVARLAAFSDGSTDVASPVVATLSDANDAEPDRSLLNDAILSGALASLPHA